MPGAAGRGPMSDQNWAEVEAEQRAESKATRLPPASQARPAPLRIFAPS